MSIIPISSHPLIPLSASYAYDDNLELLPTHIIDSTTGYYGINNPIFNNIKDVKIINNSLFFITSAMNPNEFLVDNIENINIFDFEVFSSMKMDNKFFTVSGDELLCIETDSVNRELFRIDKNDDETYSFIDINNNYWTVGLIHPWNITLEEQLTPDTYNQQTFNLEFSGSSVFIRTRFSNVNYPPYLPEYYERWVGIDETTGRVGANHYLLADKNEVRIYIPEYKTSSFQKGYNSNSAFIKYYNEFNDLTHNKDLTFKNVIKNIKNNYLVDCPYKSNIIENDMAVNIATLKNINTPEYDYAKAPYFIENTITNVTSANVVNAVKRREYDQLFMGSNQERGYENPCLGFTADTKQLIFKADAVTYFHYPKTGQQNIPIQYIGFVESGAIPGNTPARSDKIWKKLADYEKNIWWGNSTHTAVSPTSAIARPVQQGTWLCSWLSGNNTNNLSGVWMDRWYYPGFATVIDAFTYNTTFLENTGAKVWDEPSQMTMDGGCWYKYFHFGNKENDKIVTALNGTGELLLRLNYDVWDDRIVEDNSVYANDGIIKNFTSDIVSNNSLNLNGDNKYCLTPYNSSYKLSDSFSVTTRVKTNDWESVKGSHIISNGINNGWNIRYTNGHFTPCIPVYETTYGHVMLLNADTEMYYDTLFPIVSTYGTPGAIAMDNNLTTWITDNNPSNKKLYKINYEGIIEDEVTFDSTASLDWVTIDRNNNAWVLNTETNTVSGFHTNTAYFSSVQFTSVSGLNRIDFDTNNILLSADYTILDRCIDSENNIYDLVVDATYITKNSINFYDALDATNIACDRNGTLWILKDGNKVVKTTSQGVDDTVCTVGDYNVDPRKIFFTYEYDDGVYNTFVWVFQQTDNKLYKLSYDCSILEIINLEDNVDVLSTRFSGQNRNSMFFDIKGDNTAYNWQTKFSNLQPRIEAQLIMNPMLSSNITLSYPSSSLVNDEYYDFTLTFNSTNTNAKFYVNGTLASQSSSVDDNEIYYNYNNSLIIGGIMGNRNAFNDDIHTTLYSLYGDIDNVKIYSSILNTFDINHIELLEFDFNDMIWNMPVGVQSFIEEIERFFKHKLPGAKSQYYNIKINNLNITNLETRAIIEEIIKETVRKIAPVYTELYRIIWE